MLSKLANKKLIAGISLIGALAFLGLIYFEWGRGGVSGANEIARINGHSIHMQDIKPLYEAIKEEYKDKITQENAEEVEKAIFDRALRTLIQKHVIIQQAAKAKVGVSNDEIMRNMLSRREFLAPDGKFDPRIYQGAPAYYKNALEKEVREDLVSQLFQIRLFDTVKTSDVDLRIYFQEKYTSRKVRFVMVRVNEEAAKGAMDNLLGANNERAKAEKAMDDFLKAAKQTGDFAGAAAARGLPVYTTDYFAFFNPIQKEGSKERFADIEFQEVFVNAFRLQPYQVSEKIALNHGFVALQLLARKEPDWNRFYKELPVLRNEYEGRARQAVLQDWYMNILERAKIVNNLDRLFKKN